MTQRIPANLETIFDVLIIGAGINGAGIARDAAMRGLSVLLVDKDDIGGGTTSCSTRLIHGGLRYLEHGELGLVHESLREREILFRVAPHLLRPLPILIPLYSGAKRGKWIVRAGMIAYDLLSFGKNLPRHRMLSPQEVLHLAPALSPEGLTGGAIYHDGQVEFAERLVVENVLSAHKHGAMVLTYHSVEAFIVSDGNVRGVQVKDGISGRNLTVSGRVVVNASGPWVDRVLKKAAAPSPQLIGGTKGSHIIVGSFQGAPSTALYVEAKADQRPFFVIPWNGKYLIGTTDIRFKGDPGSAQIDNRETDYLLTETNRLLPNARLSRESILFTYSGVRPLAFTDNQDEQSITRRHFVREHASLSTIISIVGGKLTTYRSLAEQAVDLIARKLGRNVPASMTASVALPGVEGHDFELFSEEFAKNTRLPTQASERLLRIYGTRASEIVQLASREEEALLEIFDPETGAIAAEVVFSFEQELAQTLTDCLLRRTMVGFNSSVGIGADEAAARVAQKFLGWSEQKARIEIEEYRHYVGRFRGGDPVD